MHLYNENILEYAEIVVTDGNSRILDSEGHSNNIPLLKITGLFSVVYLNLVCAKSMQKVFGR